MVVLKHSEICLLKFMFDCVITLNVDGNMLDDIPLDVDFVASLETLFVQENYSANSHQIFFKI